MNSFRKFTSKKCNSRPDNRGLYGWAALTILCALVGGACLQAAESPSGRFEIQFEQSAPYGSSRELMRHLGFTLPVPEYDLSKEKFLAIVPALYSGVSSNASWGLLVWVSPGDDPRIPGVWEAELEKQRLLLVSACDAGNTRHAIQRCRLTLDAVYNMARRYRLDPRRIFIGGMSGGGRIASIMGVAYGDLFTGTLAICGVDFYRNVPAGPKEVYPGTYKASPGILARAKLSGRFVLITGEHDPNRDNTRATANDGFIRDGFKHVTYLEISGMGHSLPSAGVLAKALELLADGSGIVDVAPKR